MKLVVAAVRPTLILWWRASGLASPKEVPASTLPARGIAPVRAKIASRSVVLPLWNGPTSAMHRGPRRSEEHTSELQSPDHLVCRLLLEKKKKKDANDAHRILQPAQRTSLTQ